VYDQETGLYYLQTRYYDPELGRFISADDLSYLGAGGELLGYNLFAYCGNNPVNRTDPDGTDWQDVFAVGIIVAATGLIILATIATGGGALVLASVGIEAAAAASAANIAVAAGLTVASESLMCAVITGGKQSTDIGKEGERQAGADQNEKQSININGRVRKPDILNSETLTEVKNVKYISNTLQLKDYADYANINGLGKTLVVRAGEGTKVAKTVIAAGWKINRLITD
jgi:RHS repeat-associated protein